MGLFIKKSELGNNMPLYTMQQQDMWLVVGLGNVGKKYDSTRHNAGFRCIDKLALSLETSWQAKPSLKCQFSQSQNGSAKILLAKPTTYMNKSGEAVQAIKQFYKIATERTIVLHDDLDIKFGEIRTRQGGSSAGNNGIRSISHHIGEDYWRIRIGIGPKSTTTQTTPVDSSDYVLTPFKSTQLKKLDSTIADGTIDLILDIIKNNHEPTTKRL